MVRAFWVILVVAAVTAILRFLPFFIFNQRRTVPGFVRYLGMVLPYSIMAMLVIYCLKEMSFLSTKEWLPSVVSVTSVIFLHIWRRNTLLSIIGGTVCYMYLIRI